jgi:hypothetical protein
LTILLHLQVVLFLLGNPSRQTGFSRIPPPLAMKQHNADDRYDNQLLMKRIEGHYRFSPLIPRNLFSKRRDNADVATPLLVLAALTGMGYALSRRRRLFYGFIFKPDANHAPRQPAPFSR